MRLSLSLKFGLLSALLILIVAGTTTYVLVYQFGRDRTRQLVGHDRELARVLAGLRDGAGRVDFQTLAGFVASSDKADLGLVYAIDLDVKGRLRQGALNPRLFARLDPEYRVLMRQGRARVVEAIAADQVVREGRIKEYALSVPKGSVRLGFDLQRIDRQIGQQTQAGAVILAIGLLLGMLAAAALARNLTRPIRNLAGAMEAVAQGDMDQTVEVTSRDELASLAGSFNQMMRTLRDVRRIRAVSSGYLSAPILGRLLKEEAPLDMATDERAVSVLVASLRGVSMAGGKLTPRALLGLVNEYLAPLLDALISSGGTVFELSPTHVQVIWGAPDDQPNAEVGAVRGALGARDAVAVESRRHGVAGLSMLQVAIGISTGRAAIGNVGSAQRHSYAVVGEPLTFATAIEKLARPGEVLVSEATYGKVQQLVEAHAAAPLMLDDLDEAVPLYRLAKML